jgi:hypothetical protein
MKFQIEWPDGKKEIVEQSDCKTVEQFVNCRFGSSKTKAKVTLVDKPEAKVASKAQK